MVFTVLIEYALILLNPQKFFSLEQCGIFMFYLNSFIQINNLDISLLGCCHKMLTSIWLTSNSLCSL